MKNHGLLPHESILPFVCNILSFLFILVLLRIKHKTCKRLWCKYSFILFHFILFYFFLFYFILFYFILFYFILFWISYTDSKAPTPKSVGSKIRKINMSNFAPDRKYEQTHWIYNTNLSVADFSTSPKVEHMSGTVGGICREAGRCTIRKIFTSMSWTSSTSTNSPVSISFSLRIKSLMSTSNFVAIMLTSFVRSSQEILFVLRVAIFSQMNFSMMYLKKSWWEE